MTHPSRTSWLPTLAILAAWSGTPRPAVSSEADSLLFGFEEPDVLSRLIRNDTQASLIDSPSGAGKSLKVQFNKATWPNVFFPAPPPTKVWNWSNVRALSLDVTNPNPYPLQVSVRVDNAGADGSQHCIQEGFDVAARNTQTLVVELGGTTDLGLWGMRGYPPGVRGETASLDPSKVVAFQVFLSMPGKPETLILDNIRTVGRLEKPRAARSKPFVDRFGQFSWTDWPGKLKDASEFVPRLAAERAELQRMPSLPDLDAFGGWLKGPKLEATGYFRTQKVRDKWWLVTPTGRLFFSLGVDCVNYADNTIITRRDDWFEELPDRQGEFKRFFSTFRGVHRGPVKEGESFNVYGANLLRKYGTTWEQDWREISYRRLTSWGFNTIGNWSRWDLFSDRVPYVVGIGIGGHHTRIPSGSDYWGQMHDVFDPQFEKDVVASVTPAAGVWKDRPYCLGIFVDNELSWGHDNTLGLAMGALNAPAGQPAKKALVDALREKYTTIEQLNTAWNTTWESWEKLLAENAFRRDVKRLTDACSKDLREFIYRFSLRYFTLIRNALRQTSVNHLYLGCRFAWGNQEAYRAAAKVCDVVSFNIYREKVDPGTYGFTSSLNAPCIIGEFHFGALDRGMFHTGLVKSKNQADRAQKYAQYVRSVADMPAFVGCHWFQYVDQPLTGRWFDGENYNIGMVNIVDQPYPELIEAARAVHREVYPRRYGP